jgi:hypothetical protein
MQSKKFFPKLYCFQKQLAYYDIFVITNNEYEIQIKDLRSENEYLSYQLKEAELKYSEMMESLNDIDYHQLLNYID